MSNNDYSPIHILTALKSIECEFPNLVGTDWPNIETQYRNLRNQIENATGPAQMLATANLMQLLAPYNPARECLSNAIVAQTKEGEILIGLAELADQLRLKPTVSQQFREAAKPGSSQRFIWQSSPTKATSLKLGNLKFEFGAISELVTGAIATVSKDILGQGVLILQAAGILMLIRSLYAALTTKLEEREATVFCGFANVTKTAGDSVIEKDILEYTNKVRQSVSLQPLDKQELGNALYKLSEIKSVERVDGTTDMWRIIEKHHLKNFQRENY